MTRLFSGKSNTMPVNVSNPKPVIAASAAAAKSTNAKACLPLDLSGINLGIGSTLKNFDSMSTKSATSSKPDEITTDMSRLIDINDNDDDDDDDDGNNVLNNTIDYDFLNNW